MTTQSNTVGHRTVIGNISLSLDGRTNGPAGEYDMGWISCDREERRAARSRVLSGAFLHDDLHGCLVAGWPSRYARKAAMTFAIRSSDVESATSGRRTMTSWAPASASSRNRPMWSSTVPALTAVAYRAGS